MIPLWGKISDIFGRKPIPLVASAAFFLGSILCGFASNISMLLAGRTIQGLGGGGMTLLVNNSISDLFSMRYARAPSYKHIVPCKCQVSGV